MRSNISLRLTKVEIEVKTDRDKTIISLETDHTVEIEINHMEAEEITIEIIDQIIEVDHEAITDMMIGETTIDMMIGEIITDKMIGQTVTGKNIEEIITETTIGQIMEETIVGNGEIELDVKVRKVLEIIIEKVQEKDLSEVEIEAEMGVEKGNHDQDQEHFLKVEMIGQDQNLF